jgi:hypothetical protein
MAGRVGPRLDRGLGLAPVDKPLKRPSPGSSSRRRDGTGGTYYPTVLEAYNRDSDYKRWRAGLDYWQGSGKSWSDLQRSYLVRPFRDFGTAPGAQLMTATLFPASGSSDGTWTVVTRQRGALILPEPLRQEMVSYDLAPAQVGAHRLILDVSGALNQEQLANWKGLIGDQFEDSAVVPPSGELLYPPVLEANPIDSVAYTLVEVDLDGGRLLFDLSRPCVRQQTSPLRPRTFWRRVPYDYRRPIPWRADGSRFLCSSHRFYCNCPDFSGARIADLVDGVTGSQSMFPRPAAGRNVSGAWEARASGYRARWRDLPARGDQRRECKHIHAVRWSLGVPFYEPSDYEIGDRDSAFIHQGDQSLSSSEVSFYHSRREVTLDLLAVPLAESSRVNIDAGDTVSLDENAPAQPGRLPVLWVTPTEPAAHRARADDWWLQPGTQVLKVFDPLLRRFVEQRTDQGLQVPVIEELVDHRLPENLLRPAPGGVPGP